MIRLEKQTDMSGFTAEEARRRWDYEPDTGLLRWKIRAARCVQIGDVTGNKDTGGYLKVKWGRKYVFAHRLIWLIVHGEWPAGEVDHINGVRADNRIANLRIVSRRKNTQNMRCHRNGHLVGAYLLKQNLKAPWLAYIYVDGRNVSLGLFTTQQEAHERYMQEINKRGLT